MLVGEERKREMNREINFQTRLRKTNRFSDIDFCFINTMKIRHRILTNDLQKSK